ncbi:Prevent-host-death family protein [Candidatus Glomeribacter gigasporarum BEG34]|uniref:Prevent-host-death family protein n=1 Tax=Candidatus Glomeribacter gigasporarum BEG34 TaxID=1070319 RepID=G2JBP1_9BURK|nr:type II toxin-antitoxin system prevent-host-death family antitoxin [Candidatus Glomeribacter gigasporarum]CCD30195.1 Prevent-host-death family protein [Candidatus Glomeribacter gigasporarum BEG34]
MPMFNTYEAKAKLSSLIKAALSGEEVIIANANNPSVKLVPYDLSTGNGFKFGVMRGEITISPDFDAPLSDDVLSLFEGKAST